MKKITAVIAGALLLLYMISPFPLFARPDQTAAKKIASADGNLFSKTTITKNIITAEKVTTESAVSRPNKNCKLSCQLRFPYL